MKSNAFQYLPYMIWIYCCNFIMHAACKKWLWLDSEEPSAHVKIWASGAHQY